jgi:tRNA (guanine37-N1)-methyltransferase
MKITVLTLFPKMIEGFLNESIIKRAQEKGRVEIEIINIRDFALDSYGTVDGRPYGGGAGMVMRVDVLTKVFASVPLPRHTILTSAKGAVFNQKKAQQLATLDHIVLLAGHYEGVDERIMSFVDEEISLGDFILTGGELACATILDSVVRLLPGVLKKENATVEESFFEVSVDDLMKIVGPHPVLTALGKKEIKAVRLLEYPHYTRPEDYQGNKVPEILLSGDPKKIKHWQLQKAFEETLAKRPDLLRTA